MEDANSQGETAAGNPAAAIGSTFPRGRIPASDAPLTPRSPLPESTPEKRRPPQLRQSDGFGESLEEPLRDACGRRLTEVTWFRTDWQRGGALTGYARYKDPAGSWQPVVVKLPVPPQERYWITRLQDHPEVVPRVYDHGEAIGGYDIAWLVMERMPYGPLGQAWGGAAFDLVIDAAVRFYQATMQVRPPEAAPPTAEKDWDAILKAARQHVADVQFPHHQRWKHALKKSQKKLKAWVTAWEQRPIDTHCHGDLHPGNAMTRRPPPHGPAVLLDLACVHPGNWVEDAVYFEHLMWSRRDRLEGRKLCSMMAKARKAAGFEVDADWPMLATIRRGLIALSTPAMLEHAGDPLHLEAVLAVLEAEV